MKIVDKDGKRYVFDIIRKKYILLTPEEEVRQFIIQLMITDFHYPKAAISVEKSFQLNQRRKRYDIVVYQSEKPWLLVECKAPSVTVSQSTFEQAGYYNLELKVPYLFITNGQTNFIMEIDFTTRQYKYLAELPEYSK
jgi:hypothetical protein